MELYRVLPVPTAEGIPKPSFFQRGERLTKRRRHMAEQLLSEIEVNGHPVTADGKINTSSLPKDFYIISHILHSVGAGKRAKEWKKFIRFLSTNNVTERYLTPKVRSELRKINKK